MRDSHRPGDLSDLELLPKRFDMFAAEMRSSLELLVNKFIPAIESIRDELKVMRDDVRAISHQQTRIASDLDDTNKRVSALEAALSKRPKRAKRK